MANLEATVGGGFETLPRVDLGQERRQERRRIAGRSRRSAVTLAALLILGPCLLVPSTRQILEQRTQLSHTDRQLAAVNTQWQRVTQTGDRTDAQIGLWARFQQSRDGRRVWDDALPALTAALPGEVSLQRAQITGSDGGVVIAAQGTSESMGGLRAFLRALAASPLFARIRLEETAADPSAGPRGVNFKISGPIAGPPP